MPYIKPEDRKRLDPYITAFNQAITPKKPGELNYIFTKLLLASNPQSYDDYNALIGVLESCKLELYRRHVAPYEDQKIFCNGDVD